MENSYNKRLFGGKSIRSKFHYARYHWLNAKINKLAPNYSSLLELGCFDGKIIETLDHKPAYYEGYDANWGNGLNLAHDKWKNFEHYKFFESQEVGTFSPTQDFDISVSMETIEHLPTNDLDLFIEKLAKHTNQYCFITVPNERGIFFLLKYIIKRITLNKNADSQYSFKELFFAVTGNLQKVERVEGGHKGFDYKDLERRLRQHFKVEKLEGAPFGFLPPSLNFTICMVLSKKEK